MAEALREELLAVPGIAGAEVETEHGVAGVRVQLAVGADADQVGAAVRQILTQHGMKPAGAAAPEVGGGPPPPPGAPGSVVSFPLVGEHARAADAASVSESEPRLESVAVEETPAGVAVVVRSGDGRSSGSTLQSGLDGLDAAIVSAVAELTEQVDTTLQHVVEHEMGDHVVVTVLVTTAEGKAATGSAIQVGGRAYAVARASWRAFTAPV